MSPLQPDQALFFLNGVLLPGIRNEQKITQSVIDAIPVDKGSYRPDDISKSALDLAWHTITTEMRFMDAVVSGAFDLSPLPMPATIKTSADMSVWYAQNFAERFAKLTALSAEQLTKIIDFRGMFQLPAVMYLNFLINHSIHHRGQLSMYLRPMGAKVPTIYGESYDTAAARNR